MTVTGHEALCFKATWWWPSAGKASPISKLDPVCRWQSQLNTSGFCDTPRMSGNVDDLDLSVLGPGPGDVNCNMFLVDPWFCCVDFN